MMKFMKRALSLLISAMLLLGCFALAEEASLLPIAIVSYDLTDEATTAALSALIEPKENALTRWERVVLSDGREAWVICQFDQTTMSNAWSRVIDAETQEVLQEDTTDTGFFATAQARWESAKGIYAGWTTASCSSCSKSPGCRSCWTLRRRRAGTRRRKPLPPR